MVFCWTKAATKDLRAKIDRGELNPNIQTAAYLGDIVSGEHYPDYKAPPLNGHGTTIVRFCQLFRCIQLERDCKAIDWQKEEEKKVRIDIGYNIITLLCMCVYPHIKLPCRRGHWQRQQQ
jgi:hypothetical protein